MRTVFWLTSITLVATAVTTLAVADYAHRHPDSTVGQCVNSVASLWHKDTPPQLSKGYEDFKARCCQETGETVACPNMFPPPQLDVDSGIPAVEELRKIARMEHVPDGGTITVGGLKADCAELPQRHLLLPDLRMNKPTSPQTVRWTGPDGLERIGIDFDVDIQTDTNKPCPKCDGGFPNTKNSPCDESKLRDLAENRFKEWDATLKSTLTLGAQKEKCEDCCPCCDYFCRLGSRVLSCYCSQMMSAIVPCACMEVNVAPRHGDEKGSITIGVAVQSHCEPKEACCTQPREFVVQVQAVKSEPCCSKCTAACKGEKCCEGACCHEAKLETRVYPAADLIMVHKSEALSPIGGQANVESLTKILTQTVEPQSWDVNGGAGHLEYYPLGKCFVISQSPAVHEKVGTLLEKLHGVVSELAEQVGRLETPIGPLPMQLPPLPGQPQLQEQLQVTDGWLTLEAEENTEIIITDDQGMFLRGSTFRLPSNDGNMKVRVVRKGTALSGKEKLAERLEGLEPDVEVVPVPPVEIDDLELNIMHGMVQLLVPVFWQGLPMAEWNDPPTCVEPERVFCPLCGMTRFTGCYQFLPPGHIIFVEDDIDDCPQLEFDLPMLWYCLPMVLF